MNTILYVTIDFNIDLVGIIFLIFLNVRRPLRFLARRSLPLAAPGQELPVSPSSSVQLGRIY